MSNTGTSESAEELTFEESRKRDAERPPLTKWILGSYGAPACSWFAFRPCSNTLGAPKTIHTARDPDLYTRHLHAVHSPHRVY